MTSFPSGPVQFPQDSLSRGYMGTEVSVTWSEPPKEVQQGIRYLKGLYSHLRHILEWSALSKLWDLSLKKLSESTFVDSYFFATSIFGPVR